MVLVNLGRFSTFNIILPSILDFIPKILGLQIASVIIRLLSSRIQGFNYLVLSPTNVVLLSRLSKPMWHDHIVVYPNIKKKNSMRVTPVIIGNQKWIIVAT
jgi:hypothetical protein